MRYYAILTLLMLVLLALNSSADPGDIEAVTASGDKVMLHPNGKWDYLDAAKAQAAQEVARTYPENQGCPPGWQGGYFGLSRCIPPGDKDYNRGSMSGKGR